MIQQTLSAISTSKVFSPRIALFIGISIYVALYNWIYIAFLFRTWDYFGFRYLPPAPQYVILACLLSLVPALWMPIDLVRPSQLLYWSIYLVLFIPSMFVPLYVALVPMASVVWLMVALFLGFAIIGAGYRVPLLQLPDIHFSKNIFWTGLFVLTVVFELWIVMVFRGHLHIVALGDIYEARSAADEILEGSKLTYGIASLSATLNPTLMVLGLAYRRRLLFLIGMLGQVLVFSTGAAKAVAFSVVLIYGFYRMLRHTTKHFGLKFLAGVLLLLGAVHIVNLATGNVYLSIPWLVATLVLFRSFGLPALCTALYQFFFQSHPLTHMSQAHIINWFIKYPYHDQIGMVVGYYYSGDPLDANAHFWATDGIGGFGLPGILIVSVLCALLFWFFDSAARRHSPVIGALVLSYTAIALLNSSLFTTAVTSGLLPTALLLWAMPKHPLDAAHIGQSFFARPRLSATSPST